MSIFDLLLLFKIRLHKSKKYSNVWKNDLIIILRRYLPLKNELSPSCPLSSRPDDGEHQAQPPDALAPQQPLSFERERTVVVSVGPPVIPQRLGLDWGRNPHKRPPHSPHPQHTRWNALTPKNCATTAVSWACASVICGTSSPCCPWARPGRASVCLRHVSLMWYRDFFLLPSSFTSCTFVTPLNRHRCCNFLSFRTICFLHYVYFSWHFSSLFSTSFSTLCIFHIASRHHWYSTRIFFGYFHTWCHVFAASLAISWIILFISL